MSKFWCLGRSTGAFVPVCSAVIFLALVFQSPAALAAKPFDHAKVARSVLQNHVRPGYARLVRAASNLKMTLQSSCLPRGELQRHTLDASFDDVVDAWGRIEDIQFGPITREMRLERILFWPDRRGRGARQVEKAIAEKDRRVLDASLLAKRSVALQGLGALEIALYGDKPPADHDNWAFRCGFARAIAANLQTIAEDIQRAWADDGAFAKLWLSAGACNSQFLSQSETTLALAKAFSQGVERVRDLRIAGPLGLNAQRRRTEAVLAASGRTMRLIAANIEGLRELFVAGGLADAIAETDADESVGGNAKLVADELFAALKIAREVVAEPDVFGQKKTAQRLIAMGFPLKNAREQAGELLALSAGLAMGFNASDGD